MPVQHNCYYYFIIINKTATIIGSSSAAINGGPPSMLSPTAVASFQVPPSNGQATEVYANGIPHYTGRIETSMTYILI